MPAPGSPPEHRAVEPSSPAAPEPLVTAAPPPPARRRRIGWIVTVVLLALALVGVSVVLALALIRLDEAITVIDEQRDVIDEKETFASAMGDLLATAEEFDGVLFGTIVPHARYESLAARAWDVRWDADAVSRLSGEVRAAQRELEEVLATAAEQAASNGSGTTYEAVIDRLGSGFVVSAIDDADALCEDDVLGCVTSDDPYTIHFDAADVSLEYMTDELRTGLAYHEFAHVLQFTNPEPTRIALEAFDGDDEVMADCFALTYLDGWKLDHTIWINAYEYWEVSIGYGVTCDAAQREAVRTWYDSLGYEARPITQ